MALTDEQRSALKEKFLRAMQAAHAAERWQTVLPFITDTASDVARQYMQAQRDAGAAYNDLMDTIDSL